MRRFKPSTPIELIEEEATRLRWLFRGRRPCLESATPPERAALALEARRTASSLALSLRERSGDPA